VIDRLGSLSAREVVRALERAGFIRQRQRGSHLTRRHPASRLTTIVSMHNRDIARPLLKGILKQAGLSEETLQEYLR
jgi:predicted RNA binding protein YcfA (HicA-like mRNA interferase family)